MNQNIGGFTDSAQLESQHLPRFSYGTALYLAARADPRIVCLGADLTWPTETHLMRERMPERFFSLGIQEANMIGVAAGMARCGDMPFAHSFCVFVTRRVYDQIAMQVAYPRTNVKIVGFIPGLTTPLGVSHQAIDDIALMRALPNMTVVEPCGPEQVAAAVQAAVSHEGPVYLRLSLTTQAPNETKPLMQLSIGQGQVLAEGTDVAILATGMMVEQALAARTLLAEHGLSATVVNLHTLKPLDTRLLERLAKSHRAVLTAENHSTVGGLGAAVAEHVALRSLPVRFGMIGVQDTFAEGGSTAYLMKKYGLGAEHIAAKAISLCRVKDPSPRD
jgi:transketolase